MNENETYLTIITPCYNAEDKMEQYFDSIHKEVSKYIDGMNAQLKDIKDEISQIRKGQRQVNYSEDELNKDLEYLLMWEENNA